MKWTKTMSNEQEIFDLQFTDIVREHLLEVDVKAEQQARSFIDKLRQTFNISPPQFYIALPVVELWIDEDGDAL